jgi:hypothetical protein
MDPIMWLVVGIIVVLILLRIFFKLAKIVLIVGLLIVAAIFLSNMMGGNTP